jgi:hypothetical protein
MRLSSLGIPATIWPILPSRMVHDGYGAVAEVKFGGVDRSARSKPVPVPLCARTSTILAEVLRDPQSLEADVSIGHDRFLTHPPLPPNLRHFLIIVNEDVK